MTRLTIYSRPGCHLCDEMKTVVSDVVARMPTGSIEVEDIDISGDAGLEQRYGGEVPVLLIDGSKAAKYRITAGELKRRLRA